MSQQSSLTLDDRLHELCRRGDRSEAESLAIAALKNEPIHEVVIEDNKAYVVTPRFRGVHRISRDSEEAVLLEKEGEYNYDDADADVDLSFSATTLSDRVYEVVHDRLTDEPDHDRPPRDSESESPSSQDAEERRASDAPATEGNERRRGYSNPLAALARLSNVTDRFF